jgi:hypothetical protein
MGLEFVVGARGGRRPDCWYFWGLQTRSRRDATGSVGLGAGKEALARSCRQGGCQLISPCPLGFASPQGDT